MKAWVLVGWLLPKSEDWVWLQVLQAMDTQAHVALVLADNADYTGLEGVGTSS